MKLITIIKALFLALCLSVASPALTATPVERHGQLRVEGNRVVNKNGDPVVLRGMSFFWSEWAPQFWNREMVDWLVDDWKVDVVRAAMSVHYKGYLKNPERETKKVETLIDAAIARGIYVIVDWHAHEPAAEGAKTFFSHIARKYGKHPNIIYETWNEPLDHHGWVAVVKPHHMAVIPAIRAIDPDSLIVAGVPTWSQDVDIAARDPLPFKNVAYALHFYAGEPDHKEPLRAKARAALKAGLALMVTEWGTTNANGNGPVDVEETRRWWRFMEDHQLSYVAWSVSDKNETSAGLHPGTPGKGPWSDAVVTPSGMLIKNHLRRMRAAQDCLDQGC